MVGNRVSIWSLVDKLGEEGGLSGAGVPSQHYFEQLHSIINQPYYNPPHHIELISTQTKNNPRNNLK